MPVPTKLAQAKLLAVYWDNYVNYLSTLDDKQPNIGQGDPKPTQRPLYFKPFSLDLNTDQYLKANATAERWATFGSSFGTAAKPTLATDDTFLVLGRFRPARIVIRTGVSTTKSIKTAKTTKRKYISYGGKNGSIPFGQVSTNTELEQYETITTAIKASGAFNAQTMKLSRVKEYA